MLPRLKTPSPEVLSECELRGETLAKSMIWRGIQNFHHNLRPGRLSLPVVFARQTGTATPQYGHDHILNLLGNCNEAYFDRRNRDCLCYERDGR